jgi:hypothetical protein
MQISKISGTGKLSTNARTRYKKVGEREGP